MNDNIKIDIKIFREWIKLYSREEITGYCSTKQCELERAASNLLSTIDHFTKELKESQERHKTSLKEIVRLSDQLKTSRESEERCANNYNGAMKDWHDDLEKLKMCRDLYKTTREALFLSSTEKEKQLTEELALEKKGTE